MLVQGLFNLMLTNAGIQAVVGKPTQRSDGAPGIFPLLAPKEVTVPYVVYQQIDGKPITSLAGPNATQHAVFLVMCFAADYPTLKLLAKAVKSLFNGFTGTLSDTSIVRSCFTYDRGDDMNADLKGTIYKTRIDVEMVFTDTGN